MFLKICQTQLDLHIHIKCYLLDAGSLTCFYNFDRGHPVVYVLTMIFVKIRQTQLDL
jgi:hypothetical protein